METFQPELGQLVHGCQSSTFECPEFVAAGLNHLASEIERVEWNITQKEYEAPTHNNGGEYATDVFTMKAYCWGDCECGWDECEYTGNHLDDCYQSRVQSDLIAMGWTVSEWGSLNPPGDDIESFYEHPHRRQVWDKWCEHFGLDKSMGVAVHCTCDFQERAEVWFHENKLGPNGHRDDCQVQVPNFKCGDFEVRWYKYMGRGMSMNLNLDANTFFDLITKCLESVRAKDSQVY